VGFEPTVFGSEVPPRSVDWNKFWEWIEAKKYRGTYSRTIFNYASKYAVCLFSRDLSKITVLSDNKRSHVLKALSALAKFLGCYEDYKQLIKNYGLKWKGRSAEDLVIDRLNKTKNPEEIFGWIRDVKEAWPELNVFMDFIAVTGLRCIEAFHSYNLIIKLTKEKALSEKYYNIESGFLGHFRFKDIFIRSSKKAFVSFVPLELLEKIGAGEPFHADYTIRKKLASLHIPQRFADIRENHASFVTQWLRPEEIDLFHGRINSSVFLKHYYNPNLIVDLRVRAAKAAKAILDKVHVNQSTGGATENKACLEKT
jgi:hypothetical protein